MAPLTFVALPAEIRQIIYRLTIPEDLDVECCPHEVTEDGWIEEIHGANIQSMSSMFTEIHNQRVPLLLANKCINMEIALLPQTTVVLEFCTCFCLREWLEDRPRREKEMTRAIKIEINSKGVNVIRRSDIEALNKSYETPPPDSLITLRCNFRSVRLARYYRDLEKIAGEDKFKVWRKELYEVADPWTPDETFVSGAACRCQGTEWQGLSHTHAIWFDRPNLSY